MKNETSKPIKYVSIKARDELVSYIESRGYTVVRTEPCLSAPAPIADHPDLWVCRLGVSDDAPVFFGDPNKLGSKYPDDVPYNVACTGKFFIHAVSLTDAELLDEVRKRDMTIVDVKQGYAKCSCVVVDENSIITYDKGISDACLTAGLSVLLVSPGFVKLEGYNTGFIGGCSGRVGDTIVFIGDLSKHPDFMKIVPFIEDRGLTCKWFDEWELTDIGSIV